MILKIELDNVESERVIRSGALLSLIEDSREIPGQMKMAQVEEMDGEEVPKEVVKKEEIPSAVPTASKEYSLDDLSKAAVNLMEKDPEKQKELINLLNNVFGVTSMPELKKEQYGDFAKGLRDIGAEI